PTERTESLRECVDSSRKTALYAAHSRDPLNEQRKMKGVPGVAGTPFVVSVTSFQLVLLRQRRQRNSLVLRVVDAVFVVPQRQSEFHAMAEYVDLLNPASGMIGGFEV